MDIITSTPRKKYLLQMVIASRRDQREKAPRRRVRLKEVSPYNDIMARQKKTTTHKRVLFDQLKPKTCRQTSRTRRRPSATSQDICRDDEFNEQDGASIASVESADISSRLEEPLSAPPMRTADNILATEIDPRSTERLKSYSSREVEGNRHVKQFQCEHAFPPTLWRRQSLAELRSWDEPKLQTGRWPRRLSFNIFPDAATAAIDNDWASSVDFDASKDHRKALVRERVLAFQAQLMAADLHRIKDFDSSVVEAKVNEVITLDDQGGRDHDILDSTYREKLEEYNNLRDATDDLLTEERINLTDAVKDIETLGAKLEYELDALQSKVEDMENGIAEYERQVVQLETRAEELDDEKEESWFRWYLNLLTGKGFA